LAELAPTEIKALVGILDDLDYYQLMHLRTDASPTEVRRAYQSTARAFHPDGHRLHDADMRSAVETISKRVTEAYSVLRNPVRRRAYDRHLESGAGHRIRIAQAGAAGERQETEKRQGMTPQGRQYFNMAAAEIDKGDFAAGVRNLQTALTFEPANAFFKEQLAAAKARRDV
jgi:curved DNA-binding protein CbpA